MKVFPIASETEGRWTHKIILTPDDLTETAAATAQTIALLSLGIAGLVQKCATYLPTPFKDASDNAFNDVQITVGDGGDVDRFITAQQINENGTEVPAKANPSTTPYAYPAADTVDIVFNSMTGKALADLDTGELWVLLCVEDLTKL